jgi:hypothetical protein
MAMTLVEPAKLSTDVLRTGVIETLIKDSPILQRLPFIEVNYPAASCEASGTGATRATGGKK